jgi:hypothetical protein
MEMRGKIPISENPISGEVGRCAYENPRVFPCPNVLESRKGKCISRSITDD